MKLLHQLSDDEREKVVEAFTLTSYKDGETVITQGESGSTFFIVKDGTMVVSKDGKQVATLSSGDYFGEQALLTDDARAATVVADKEAECFVLDRWALDLQRLCSFRCFKQGHVHAAAWPIEGYFPARRQSSSSAAATANMGAASA